MNKVRRIIKLIIPLVLIFPVQVIGSELSVSGYLQSQTGIFISPYEYKFNEEGYPTDHGGYLGQLSMFRNTFQLELER